MTSNLECITLNDDCFHFGTIIAKLCKNAFLFWNDACFDIQKLVAGFHIIQPLKFPYQVSKNENIKYM